MAASGRMHGAGPAAGARISEALQKLRNREIGLDEYLDFHADVATSHLKHVLPEAEIAVVRDVMLEQLRTDPVLVQAIRTLTGHDPARTDSSGTTPSR